MKTKNRSKAVKVKFKPETKCYQTMIGEKHYVAGCRGKGNMLLLRFRNGRSYRTILLSPKGVAAMMAVICRVAEPDA